MRREVNPNWFEISPSGNISLRCKGISLSQFTWLQSETHFVVNFTLINLTGVKFQTAVSAESFKLITSAHVRYYCYWKNNQYHKICFTLVKVALIKSYHFRKCNRTLLSFEKLPQRNRHINGTIFESGLRSQGWPQWNCHVTRMTMVMLKSRRDVMPMPVYDVINANKAFHQLMKKL